MKSNRILLAVIAMIIMIANIGLTNELADDVYLSGSMRWRGELDDKDFDMSTPISGFQYLRTRLELDIKSIEKAQVYIQIQDSRYLGSNSGSLTNDTNLGMHQGYIKVNKLFNKNLSVQLGRFEAVYGRERVLGAVGWSNVGRSFDGIRLSYQADGNNYDLFALKLIERYFSFPSDYRDRTLYGIYSTILENHLDLFALYEWDQQKTAGEYNLARYTLGLYYRRALDEYLSVDLDFAYQGGKQAGTEISAFMAAGLIMYKTSNPENKFGLGFDITSGDDNPIDDEINYYNNLYYTGHKFRGFMDYFTGTMARGLADIFLRGAVAPSPDTRLGIDIHYFRTMKEYSFIGGTSTTIGQEIDLTGKYILNQQLNLTSGASLFSVSDDYWPSSDPGIWFYAMLVTSFE